MNTILILIDKDTKKSFNKLFVDVNNRFSPQEINAICSNIESDLNKNLIVSCRESYFTLMLIQLSYLGLLNKFWENDTK